ncbi:MAG: DNA-processing protein DprA [Phycisphaerales bacterium]
MGDTPPNHEEAAGHVRDVLHLTMAPGFGPVLIARAIRALGSARAVLEASPEKLRTIDGIGPERAKAMAMRRSDVADAAAKEMDEAAKLGVRLVALSSPEYPSLLAEIPDPPPILYVRGTLDAERDRYPVAIVGSRRCTPYGTEQAERFGAGLASAGLTVVSGGARGIDTGAHQAAMRIGGRTVAVVGCGLAHHYPPENKGLFEKLAAGAGAVVSELPLHTQPSAENFPARNRIISGMSLGVIVIEAGRGSGALITARQAAEEHGREVFAVPGRVDSAASEGTHELLKAGGALLVTSPADVIAALEQPAFHAHRGTHEARYATTSDTGLFTEPKCEPIGLTPMQSKILEALGQPCTLDDLVRATELPAGALMAELTMLEMRRAVKRKGSMLTRA